MWGHRNIELTLVSTLQIRPRKIIFNIVFETVKGLSGTGNRMSD